MKRLALAALLAVSPLLAQSNGWQEIANSWGEIQTATGGGSGTVTTTGSPAATYCGIFSAASSITGTSACVIVGGVITATGFAGPLTGNASTATALAANPANCASGQLPRGVDASGVAEGCAAVNLVTEVTGTLAAGNVATLNQNTTGTAANVSGTPALPNGTTATTQSAGDNTTKLATTAFVIANGGSAPFSDATALVKNASDATKLFKVDASGITASNTVTMGVTGTSTAGRYGINTLTPGVPLEVVGTAASGVDVARVRLRNTNVGAGNPAYLEWGQTTGGGAFSQRGYLGDGGDGGKTDFYNVGAVNVYANNALRLYLDSNLNVTGKALPAADVTYDLGSTSFQWSAAYLSTLVQSGLTTKYNGVTTAGLGVPAIYGSGRSTAQTGAVASVATYTVGAADGSFLVSANVLVTTSSAESFTVTCAYTDEGNTARTLTLSFASLAGTLVTAVNFANGAAPYEGSLVHIRAKASTAITVATTGTFTGATYNVEATIAQIK